MPYVLNNWVSLIYGTAIDEITNTYFNFQQNISKLKFSVYSDTFIKRTARASPFPCVFHQQWFYRWTARVLSFWRFEFSFSVGFSRGIFLESNFLIWGLNSFQQLAISIPFSRFIRMFGEMVFQRFKQSIKIASLIFLFLQCGSKSRNTRFSQSIICFLFCFKCCAKPFVLCLHLIAYSCWYLRELKNCWVSPR